MKMQVRRLFWLSLATACGAVSAQPAPPGAGLAGDPAALTELVSAVSMDAMSEASLTACEDIGALSAPAMRTAWLAWRDKHQLASLRLVVAELMRRQGSRAPPWSTLTEPMRQRVLAAPVPDEICAGLVRDWQTPAMDVAALYPRARPTAMALVQGKLVSKPSLPEVFAGAARGQFLVPSQIPALHKQVGSLSSIGEEAAQQRLGFVYVKGQVQRFQQNPDRYCVVQEQGERHAGEHVFLGIDAEPWVGREIVLRGLITSLSSGSMQLAQAALVRDASGLTPSPLAQEPLSRKEVLLQRVMSTAGKGLPDKDLVAVVIHGQGNYNNGSRWEEDVRYLLRDGSVYHRTEMPPDQLNVAASRRLEPQRWGRWRAAGNGYQMQAQDDEGRPLGDWKAEKHHAVKPWPQDTRLEGSFSRGSFYGSLMSTSTASRHGIRFTRDGRFERSYSSQSSSGSIAATLNGAVISASSRGDGSGSSSSGGGTVSGAMGTSGAISSSKTDDGASRRGRYQINGFVMLLTYDDGHQERLLSFPVHGDDKTVYVGDGSVSRDK